MENSHSSNHRFRDKNFVSSTFSKRLLVKCPNCEKRAEVNTDFSTYHSTFYCPNCHYQHTSSNKRFSLELKVYCNACAKRISIHMPQVKTKKQAIRIQCPSCGAMQSHQPTYTEWITFGGRMGQDPFFGLELWLQSRFRNHLFWAYNLEHLLYLEEYIAAKLRERQDRKYMTLVEKLPEFIKSRKNREDLIKLVEKLKVK